jgi:uncharacterized membrane protein YbhN (UPF0104 family)
MKLRLDSLNRNLLIGLKLAISVGLIAFLLSRVGLEVVEARFSQLRVEFLAAATAALFAQVFFATYRWRTLLNGMRIHTTALGAFRLVFIGLFFNQTLPSTVGGDVARAWALPARADRCRVRRPV